MPYDRISSGIPEDDRHSKLDRVIQTIFAVGALIFGLVSTPMDLALSQPGHTAWNIGIPVSKGSAR